MADAGTEKPKNYAPFGSKADRFDLHNVHPRIKNPGTYIGFAYSREGQEFSHLGPGKYDWFKPAVNADGTKGVSWQREMQGKVMLGLSSKVRKNREKADANLGPGAYDIGDFLSDARTKPQARNGAFGTTSPRFRAEEQERTPGPGTYGNPWGRVEEGEKKSFCTVAWMDSKTSGERTLPQTGSQLGPGTYQIKGFVDELVEKRVSTRGPYDLFSGQRHKIQSGHFATGKPNDLAPGQYNVRSGIDDLLQNKYKQKNGQFGKVQRFLKRPLERIYWMNPGDVPREADEPGPAAYNPDETAKLERVKQVDLHKGKAPPPFGVGASRIDKKSFMTSSNTVGAGRYDIQKWDETYYVNGHKSVFDSKMDRMDPKMESILRERVRVRNAGGEEALAFDLNAGVGAKRSVMMAS